MESASCITDDAGRATQCDKSQVIGSGGGWAMRCLFSEETGAHNRAISDCKLITSHFYSPMCHGLIRNKKLMGGSFTFTLAVNIPEVRVVYLQLLRLWHVQRPARGPAASVFRPLSLTIEKNLNKFVYLTYYK